MPSYLFHFADAHNEFRLPELKSIAELYGFPITLPQNDDDRDPTRPCMVIELEEEEHARILANRCILIKSVFEFYGQGSSYEALHAANRRNETLWHRYVKDTSFRFLVTAYNHTIPQSRQRDVIESFAYMGFLGKIDMKTPDITLTCFEEYKDRHGTTREKHEGDGNFRQVFFGRLLFEGSARHLIGKFNVKTRVYYGNTSMDSEMSLLMANQTLASPGKLIYDPFMGTGSMAYPAAHFGALVFGSDIDGRQMRGKEKTPGVVRAATQYGVASRLVDLSVFDLTHHPWRCGGLFDAIVTDPPYGVRAGAKRLGRKKQLTEVQKELMLKHRLSSPSQDEQPYIPPTKPYELSQLVTDLVLFARYLLKPGGRLVFFLPTVTDEYEEIDIHTMLCEGMEVIANSLQDFGSWGRRLVTIKKITEEQYPAPTFNPIPLQDENTHVPAHKDFREKYFQGFKSAISEDRQDHS
ncbi:tRNA guanosine-2'-O-methyltransferase [Phlegmacium glaucopus]|nr:tRNA guanosine-2'-O-methyltransferase [Phlegmacium glaucopus]